MIEIKTEIVIDTDQHTLWRVLTELNTYPEWNDFFKTISGEVREGSTLKITITPPNAKPMSFTPKVAKVDPQNELRWRGAFLHSSIFQGEHYFLLEKISDKQTRFIHGEKFTGLLTPIFKLIGFERNTRLGFEAFNLAIKTRAEQSN